MKAPQYEICIRGEWHPVDETVWRSYTGARCHNGKVYQGRRFTFMGGTLAAGVMTDLCADCAEVFIEHHDPNPENDIVCPACDAKRKDWE